MEFKESRNPSIHAISCKGFDLKKVTPNIYHNTQIQGMVDYQCVINAIGRSLPRLICISKERDYVLNTSSTAN
jgi:hypothetical protein